MTKPEITITVEDLPSGYTTRVETDASGRFVTLRIMPPKLPGKVVINADGMYTATPSPNDPVELARAEHLPSAVDLLVCYFWASDKMGGLPISGYSPKRQAALIAAAYPFETVFYSTSELQDAIECFDGAKEYWCEKIKDHDAGEILKRAKRNFLDARRSWAPFRSA